MEELRFPFTRGVEADLGQLREFFRELSSFRQADQSFSQKVRENRLPWKAWNEELVPLMYVADGLGLPDSERFRLMPEGDPVDLELTSDRERRLFQVTVAELAWPGGKLPPGHVRALKTERLAQGHVWGGARVRRENGTVISEPHARGVDDDVQACKAGLIAALERKSKFDGRGQSLLVLARDFTPLLYDVDVRSMIEDAVAAAPSTSFGQLFVVDSGVFWQREP